MSELVLASLFLLGSHFGLASTPLRPWLVRRLGDRVYLGCYSVLALLAFFWLIGAYRRAELVMLWAPASWQVWAALLIMPIALLFIVAGLTTPNPTMAGGALVDKKIEAPRGILRVTRHPAMWAFGLFALSHLLANGELGALLFFGAIAALALIGTLLIDARYRSRLGTAWSSFADQTSNLPFAAILAGRQQLRLAEIGWARVGLAAGLYGLLLALHPWLSGVSALGGL
jgi:uncharacterized membrane protein